MKKFTNPLLILVVLTTLSGCKAFWEYQKEKKKGEVTTMSNAYRIFSANIDSIMAEKMTSYKSATNFTSKNEGYFRVENINEESAPYLIGSVLTKKGGKVVDENYPNLLIDQEFLDTKINFDKPEISVFINKSASTNINAISVAQGEMSASDRMRIVYSKVFVSQPTEKDWFNFDKWDSTITKYGLKESDSLFVISNVLVKKFSYYVYQSFGGQFSATPTPVVAIDGKVFQESGGEQNIYEVFIQVSRLKYPIKKAPVALNELYNIYKTDTAKVMKGMFESYLNPLNANVYNRIDGIKFEKIIKKQ